MIEPLILQTKTGQVRLWKTPDGQVKIDIATTHTIEEQALSNDQVAELGRWCLAAPEEAPRVTLWEKEGTWRVQIDAEDEPGRDEPAIRVYLNEATLYPVERSSAACPVLPEDREERPKVMAEVCPHTNRDDHSVLGERCLDCFLSEPELPPKGQAGRMRGQQLRDALAAAGAEDEVIESIPLGTPSTPGVLPEVPSVEVLEPWVESPSRQSWLSGDLKTTAWAQVTTAALGQFAWGVCAGGAQASGTAADFVEAKAVCERVARCLLTQAEGAAEAPKPQSADRAQYFEQCARDLGLELSRWRARVADLEAERNRLQTGQAVAVELGKRAEARAEQAGRLLRAAQAEEADHG